MQIHQLQKRSEGNNDTTEIGDIFQVVEDDDNDDEVNLEGNQSVGMESNEISKKTDEATTCLKEKRSNEKEAEEDTSDCIEIMEEGQNERGFERNTTNSGKRKYLSFVRRGK